MPADENKIVPILTFSYLPKSSRKAIIRDEESDIARTVELETYRKLVQRAYDIFGRYLVAHYGPFVERELRAWMQDAKGLFEPVEPN